MENIKKTINITLVKYSVFNDTGQTIERELLFPRKLSPAAALREAKKLESNEKSIIQLSLKVKTTKKTFVMPFQQFFDEAAIQE